jgi:UDP-N-acetylglucosamine--N-acetylmuramyl-(pentapeptide) pyrophosphoryl-undecaprenol N-acetylglucosamine transferase
VALEPVAFLDDVAGEMRAADLVVARAGATTLAELAAVGRAAVLVPFGAAADDHQRANARALADRGAAVVLDEAGRLDDSLGSAVRSLFGDRARLERMHRAMAACARPDAAARVVDRLLELSA